MSVYAIEDVRRVVFETRRGMRVAFDAVNLIRIQKDVRVDEPMRYVIEFFANSPTVEQWSVSEEVVARVEPARPVRSIRFEEEG